MADTVCHFQSEVLKSTGHSRRWWTKVFRVQGWYNPKSQVYTGRVKTVKTFPTGRMTQKKKRGRR